MRRTLAPNPLIPPIRMRALYRALLEARVLGGSNRWLQPGSEAPLAATILALAPQDLVSVHGDPRLLTHLRGVGARCHAGPPSRRAIRLLRQPVASKPPAVTEVERTLHAVGAAQALRSREPRAVVLFFVGRADASSLGRAFVFAQRERLPLVFVAEAQQAPALRAAPRGLPVIPVDAADPVALHRVAQETVARARAGDGPAAIDCVRSDGDARRKLRASMIASGHAAPGWFRFIERDLRHRLRVASRG